MNNIVIHGRLTRDPELRTTNNGKEVANFCVAVNRRFDRDTADYFDCQAWGKAAVFIQQYFRKGQEILVRGSMQSRKWQDKDGNTVLTGSSLLTNKIFVERNRKTRQLQRKHRSHSTKMISFRLTTVICRFRRC